MVEIVTLDGTRTSLTETSIASLRDNLRGELVVPGDAILMKAARRVWNANVDRRPSLDRALCRCRRCPARGFVRCP